MLLTDRVPEYIYESLKREDVDTEKISVDETVEEILKIKKG